MRSLATRADLKSAGTFTPVYPIIATNMPIFSALGIGVLILVLGWLVPNVLAELEATVIAFLRGARVSADAAAAIAATAGTTPPSVPLSAIPLTLPTAPMSNP